MEGSGFVQIIRVPGGPKPHGCHGSGRPKPVIRIRDILVQIGSIDPAPFVSYLQDAKKNFAYPVLLFEGKFTSFFKDKNPLRRHKTVEIMVFLTILD
jgi:hypothetical protein